MNVPIILLLAAVCSPAHASLSRSDVNFDGVRARSEAPLVPAGSSTDGRTAEQIAKDEQAKADARAAARAPGARLEFGPPAPSELEPREKIVGAAAALDGAAPGALPGLTGLVLGVLLGGSIGYAMSRVTA